MQIEVNTEKGKVLFVAVPKTGQYKIVKYPISGKYIVYCDSDELNAWKVKLDDKIKYDRFFLASQMTEELARELGLTLEEFHSLMRANKIDITKEWILLKILDN